MPSEIELFMKQSVSKLKAARKHGHEVHIQFLGDVMGETIAKLQRVFEKIRELEVPEVTLAISSGGGTTVLSFETYNILRAVRSVVLTTHNIGVIASAAHELFLSADPERRFAAPFSFFVFHSGTLALRSNSMTTAEIRNQLEYSQMFDKLLEQIILKETRIHRQRFREVLRDRHDWHLPAQEAVRSGYLHGKQQVKEYTIPKNASVISLYDPEQK